MSWTSIRRWAREPALQFLVIGAALFGLHSLIRPARSWTDSPRMIRVTREDVQKLREGHFALMGRMPSPDEERQIVERFVNDEVLYREALALGLDRGDSVVRGRLAQKMQFLTEDLNPIAEPSEAELQEFLIRSGKYVRPAKVTLRHVFFSRDRRGESARPDAEKLLARLKAGDERAASLGDPFMLGHSFADRSESDLSGLFGATFAKEVFALSPGAWSGPIASSYGAHLVRVEQITASAIAPLEQVRARLRQDWIEQRRQESNRAAVSKLRERYKIEVDTGASPATAKAR